MSAPRLTVPDPVERDDLAVFVGRAVRLEPSAVVRLRTDPRMPGRVDLWAPTPFDTLVTRAARGAVEPHDVTVVGSDLLAALAVVGGETVALGARVDERWRGALPAAQAWTRLDDVPVATVDGLAERGVAAAREGDPTGRPSAGLLDQVVLTVSDGGEQARVPMRCVFSLAGMGFLADGGAGDDGGVRVSVGGDWLRLDARGGAVVRRRRRASLDLRPV